MFQMTTILSKMNNLSYSFAFLLSIFILLMYLILFLGFIKQNANTVFISDYRNRGNRKYCLNNKRQFSSFHSFPTLICNFVKKVLRHHTSKYSKYPKLSISINPFCVPAKGLNMPSSQILSLKFFLWKIYKDFRFYRLSFCSYLYLHSILMPEVCLWNLSWAFSKWPPLKKKSHWNKCSVFVSFL